MNIRLATYNNDGYSPGRALPWQIAWFFIGLPLLRSSVIPSTGFRVLLLRIFGAEIGDGVVIKPGVRVKFPWRLRLGDNCWIGEDAWIDNLDFVLISNDVCVSQGAYLCTGNHDWSDSSFRLITKPIHLHPGSWVGARATVAPGVVLRECAVAGAGSVISKSIPAYEVHSGNPAVLVRHRVVKDVPLKSKQPPVEIRFVPSTQQSLSDEADELEPQQKSQTLLPRFRK